MNRSWFGRLQDRLRSHPWWPIHYRSLDGGPSWWAWRGRYYGMGKEHRRG